MFNEINQYNVKKNFKQKKYYYISLLYIVVITIADMMIRVH